MFIKLVMPSNYLILCHPRLLLPSIFPSIRVFFNESVLHIRWQSIGASASASVLPMNIQDWFPLGLLGWVSLQSMGLLRLLKHHRSKASILWHSVFFMVQLSHPYMATGKTITLTTWTFVGKVVSLGLYLTPYVFNICFMVLFSVKKSSLSKTLHIRFSVISQEFWHIWMFSSTLHRTESHNAENTVDFGSTSSEASVGGKIFSYTGSSPN